jgi:hypothetical protein
MMQPGGSNTRLRWRGSDEHLPAIVYLSEGFEILWDPAGLTEGEPGGWYVYRGEQHKQLLDIAPTLTAAKAVAEKARLDVA